MCFWVGFNVWFIGGVVNILKGIRFMLKREVGVCHVQWLLPFFFLKAENCFVHLFNGSGYHLETFYAFPLSHTLFFKNYFLLFFFLIIKLKFQVFNLFKKKKIDCESHMPAIDLECTTSPSIPLFLYGRRKCHFN